MAKIEDTTERLHCNKCGAGTKHLLFASRTKQLSQTVPYDSGNTYEITWTTIYDIFECCGCEEVIMRSKSYFSEADYDDVGILYYPPRIGRRLPPWEDKLPDPLSSLLREVYTAIQADSRRLAMMGARAIIDMILLDKVGDIGSFNNKISKLVEDGYLSDRNLAVLKAALNVGNAASHRGHKPKEEHVQDVMDIIENLLHSTLLEDLVDDLNNATPRRPKPKKKPQDKS